MQTRRDDAAFPYESTCDDGSTVGEPGLSKLEYFSIEILKASIQSGLFRDGYYASLHSVWTAKYLIKALNGTASEPTTINEEGQDDE